MILASPYELEELRRKEELMKLLEEKARLERQNALALYAPHRKQDMFHRAGSYKRRYYRAGNRSGKSTVGVVEDCAWALGYRPWYPEGDPARYAGIPQRPTKGIVTASDWDKVEEIFTLQVDDPDKQGKFIKYIPPDRLLNVLKNQSGKVCTLIVKSIHGGESTINFETVKGFKSNPMGLESSSCDYIHVDEPCPEEMWVAMSRGLVDTEGSAWFTCTPIMEMWINDMFLPEGATRTDKNDGYVHEREIEGHTLQTWMVTGSMNDNPHLSEGAKLAFMADLKDDDIEARIHGRPKLFAGCIYREFDDSIHIYHELPRGWMDYDSPPRDYCIRIAIDTHPRTPHACLFAATAPNGHTYFWSEIFEHTSISDYCKQIYTILDGRWPHRCLLEQAAYNENGDNEITLASLFMDAGLPVEPAVKDLTFGIMKVRDELLKRDIRYPKNPPLLHFSPKLRETLREFSRYVWNPNTGKPVDKDDHMMENLYRLVLTGLDYVEPSEATYGVIPLMDLRKPNAALPPMPKMDMHDFVTRPLPRAKRRDYNSPYDMRRAQSWNPLDLSPNFTWPE